VNGAFSVHTHGTVWLDNGLLFLVVSQRVRVEPVGAIEGQQHLGQAYATDILDGGMVLGYDRHFVFVCLAF
jgi:hypothetical protein